MGLRIIGISFLVAFAMLFASIGIWYISVPLAAFIGNPHSADTLACVKYLFLGVFVTAYVMAFSWQVYQTLHGERVE